MFKAYGLKTHIWNNNLRSIVLLLLFPLLLLVLIYGLNLLWLGLTQDFTLEQGVIQAGRAIPSLIPYALAVAGTWFLVAFFTHQTLIDMSTGAKSVNPAHLPRAHKLLETLCISRGMITPKLKLINTSVMNAYASGIREKNYAVTLTSGLIENLSDDELEAVIAHELTHIRNRDVRLLVIAIIFVGIFSFFGEGIVRAILRGNISRSQTHRRSGGVNAGALVVIAIGLMVLTYVLALMLRFALSRRREYMADAGAVELTKNPDAMIRALQKISGHAALDAPAEVREMAFQNPRIGLAGLFATHPPIEKRIQALIQYGSGR